MNSFENWVENIAKPTSEIAYIHFKESMICYNNKAYRASFIFSYLGFLKYLVGSINNSKKPKQLKQGQWDDFLKKITKNEKGWEPQLVTEIKKKESDILVLDQHVIDKFMYFKEIRNDCAHDRNEIIKYHHIEILWSFIESNYLKFSLQGSKENYLERLTEHFDISLTSRTKTYDNFIEEIKLLGIKDYNVFFTDINEILFASGINTNEFFNNVLTLYYNNDDILKAVKKVIFSKNNNSDLQYLHKFPEDFTKFHFSETEIRSIWFTRVYNANSSSYLRHFILSVLLQKNLISEEDKSDFFNKFIKNFDQMYYNNFHLDSEYIVYFKDKIFFSELKKYLFDDQRLRDKQSYKKADLYAFYFTYSDFTEQDLEFFIKLLNETYQSYYYNSFQSRYFGYLKFDNNLWTAKNKILEEYLREKIIN